ncbi:MAG: hypothetical protein F6K35_27455 [Okeania sp. SIO2H7]|nr:hypothetical protein [Okeania sp. SIO2H7]
MNLRLIVFAGIIMALIGSVIGLAAAEMSKKPYQCCDPIQISKGYNGPRYPRSYATAGAILGFSVGCIQEAIRELKPQDEEI